MLRHDEPAPVVEDIVEDWCAGDVADSQAMAALGRRVVVDVVAGEAQEKVVGDIEFRTYAKAERVLVVVLEARHVEIVAEAVTRELRHRSADPDRVGQCRRTGQHPFELAVGADREPEFDLRLVRQPACDVLDRTANGIAAVQRALRTAEHFDAINLVEIEYRRMWTIEIDVIDIQPDTRLEAGDRVLLADAANERGQSRVGAARNLERDVRTLLRYFDNVDGRDAIEFVTRHHRDR